MLTQMLPARASHGYDSNGNTTVSGTTNYQYDVMNHLTNVNTGQIIMAYDGDGNRVSKKVNGVTTYYLVDDRNPSGYAQVVEEYQGTKLSRVYDFGLDLISQRQVVSGTVSYYGYDGHGSIRFLTDASGSVTDTYAYDAYGLLVAKTGSTPNNYLYCGEQWDADLGLYYLRARYLNPNTGRFWSMDSFSGNKQNPLSLHKYLYCSDGPINACDPSGHSELACELGTMALRAFIAAMIITATVQVIEHEPRVWVTGSGGTSTGTSPAPRPSPEPAPIQSPPPIVDVLPSPDDEDLSDDRLIYYHYSQDTPSRFAMGLFPPAWVTDADGLDSRTAMFDLGIAPPNYEYAVKVSLDMLGGGNNSTPGRRNQWPIIKPTGPGSVIACKKLQ